MKNITLLTTLLLGTISYSQLRINEVDVDQTGTDATEFVEILSDLPSFPLDGFLLVFYNGSDNKSYKTIDLTSFVTDANGFFIIGSDATTGVDIAIGASNTIQNGPDAVAIYQDDVANFPNDTPVTNANLVDAIVYGTNDDDDLELLTGLNQTTQYNEDLNGNKDTESIQNDGAGSFCVNLPTLRDINLCALGVAETHFDTFKVYPNPATNGYVDILSKRTGSKSISIFNVLGKQVFKITLFGNRLDISKLNSGIYIIKITQGKIAATKKLVVK